jgi:hypothetical protein
MGLFTRHDKTIAEIAPRKATLEKKIAAKTAEEREYAQLLQQEAEAVAARAAEEAEYAQLTAERADLAPNIALFDALEKDQIAGLRYMATLVHICERGYLGDAQPIAQAHAMAVHAADFHTELRARQASMNARLKVLEG